MSAAATGRGQRFSEPVVSPSAEAPPPYTAPGLPGARVTVPSNASAFLARALLVSAERWDLYSRPPCGQRRAVERGSAVTSSGRRGCVRVRPLRHASRGSSTLSATPYGSAITAVGLSTPTLAGYGAT